MTLTPVCAADLFEAVTHQLVGDEYLALFVRQLVQSGAHFFQQHASRVRCVRSGIGRGQQSSSWSISPSSLVLAGSFLNASRPSLAKEVRDSIAGHAEQPGGYLLHRFHHAVGFHEFVEDILQDVFRVLAVGHAPPDEVAQPGLLPSDRFRDPLVLLRHRPLFGQRRIHPLRCRRMSATNIVWR